MSVAPCPPPRLKAALHACLDLLVASEADGLRWGTPELTTAFHWMAALRELAADSSARPFLEVALQVR